jgi:hypothetical protein
MREQTVKTQYKSFNFRADSLAKIELANSIIASYQAQGLRLTLRQLYYQFVTRNALPNREKSYDSLGRLVSDARLAGLIDWEAIEDRVRVPRLPTEFSDLKDLINAALQSYRLPRWKGQSHYIELWVEKDALSGVLTPLAEQYHITLMVNRGYSSQSAMYEAGLRFIAHSDKTCTLFYLGDHDPSGEDMVRDIEERLSMFGAILRVKKIALTMDQQEARSRHNDQVKNCSVFNVPVYSWFDYSSFCLQWSSEYPHNQSNFDHLSATY